MLNSDCDTNQECLDFVHFGKDFKYSLKNDGSIVTDEMDRQNDVEVECKKVYVDKPNFGENLISKLTNIILNANNTLQQSDFIVSNSKNQSE